MRPVYMISGGITKFTKAEPRKSFRKMAKEAFDYAMNDCPRLTKDMIEGSVVPGGAGAGCGARFTATRARELTSPSALWRAPARRSRRRRER